MAKFVLLLLGFAMPMLAAANPTTPAPLAPLLDGLGTFDFPFDPDAFAPFDTALTDAPVGIVLTIDAGGVATECAVAASDQSPSHQAGVQLCKVARQGHLVVPTWYAPFMQGGRIGLRLAVATNRVPERPIRFVDPAQGMRVRIKCNEERCGTANVQGSQTTALSDARAVSDAFVDAGRPGLKGDGANSFAEIGVAIDRARDTFSDPSTGPLIADWGRAVDFAPAPTAPDQNLTAADGKLVGSISADDYPLRALQEYLDGQVKVLLGFDRTGAARVCRPLHSSNSSFLANQTCEVMVRKLRFAFLPNAPTYDGLRYRAVPINWFIPRD